MENLKKIRVLIADDHEAYREGLCALLSRETMIETVAAFSNGKELVEASLSLEPDIILTDLNMPVLDGIGAILQLVHSKLPLRIIVISTYDQEVRIVEALEAGAFGYVPKNAHPGEIPEAIRTVYRGSPYFSLSTSTKLVAMINQSQFNPYLHSQPQLFSSREKTIIRLICQDRSTKQISELLKLGERRVEDIRAGILAKMQVHNAAGIAIYAAKNGLFQVME